MKRIVLSLLVSGLLVLPVYAQSGQGQAGQQQGAGSLSQTDRQFLKHAAAGNMAEVELGKLGQQKGTSPKVKELAQRLVTDHQQNLQMLQSLAQKEGVKLPTSANPKDKAAADKMSKLEGAAFDKAFARHAVMDHQKDIAKFKQQESTTSNPDVKRYASETLPKLQEHLQLAQTAAQKSGASSSAHQHAH